MPVLTGRADVTFSHLGEDLIMYRMLERYGITDITYFDIGANDPIHGSNTYFFYLRGYTGLLIEPNQVLVEKNKSVRPNDKILNIGVSADNQTEADYFMFSTEQCGLNTFSREQAENYDRDGFKIQKVVKLPLVDVNEVIAKNFTKSPTILSIDVEGLDEIILSRMDFNRFHPLLICVETVDFNKNKEFVRRQSIFDLLQSKGYFVYADTSVNTIFCSRKLMDDINKGTYKG